MKTVTTAMAATKPIDVVRTLAIASSILWRNLDSIPDSIPCNGARSPLRRSGPAPGTSLAGIVRIKPRLPGQLLAAGQQGVYDAPDRLAILDLQGGDGHLIARLEGRFAPADVEHRRRILRLHNPRHHLPAVICNVEVKDAMGIGPRPLRDGPLENNGLRIVVHRVAVVREQGQRKRRNSKNQNERR